MEKAKVCFTDFRTEFHGTGRGDKLRRLLKFAGFETIDFRDKFVAIKMHFGEAGNLAYLRPQYAKVVADCVRELGGKPYLTWYAVTGATKYEIWRTDANGNCTLIGSTAKKYFSDTNFQHGVTYSYMIKAVNSITESPMSSAVSVFAK